MTDLLDLDGWEVLSVEKHDNPPGYTITARCISVPDHCPKCGGSALLKKFGTLRVSYKDIPVRGRTVIVTDRQRYTCSICNKTFFQKMTGISEGFRATKRLVDEIGNRAVNETFQYVADSLFVEHKTVRSIFEAKEKVIAKNHVFTTPAWLGIDEIHIGGRPRCVLTNVYDKTIFDILPSRKKDTVFERLWSIKDKEKVLFVTMDMWSTYRDVVKLVFPKARIVVDKFHVLKMANAGLDMVRVKLRDSLSNAERRLLMRNKSILRKKAKDLTFTDNLNLEYWLNRAPILRAAYQLKESFYAIWESKTKDEALDSYLLWAAEIPVELQPTFKPITTALKNWEKEVFAYFDWPITNAYTESMNNLIREIDRTGRGYSFKTIRCKVLYAMGINTTSKEARHLIVKGYTEQGTVIDVLVRFMTIEPTDFFPSRKGRKMRISTTNEECDE